MQGKIRGFMHLDNGQESIPALLADSIRKDDLKHSYYRDHCHAIASGVDPGAVMAELYGKDDGTCRGTGGSMHIYDQATNFQGGWALVAEQLANLRRREGEDLGHEGRVHLEGARLDAGPFVEERAQAPEGALQRSKRAEVALEPAVQRRREAFYRISQELT